MHKNLLFLFVTVSFHVSTNIAFAEDDSLEAQLSKGGFSALETVSNSSRCVLADGFAVLSKSDDSTVDIPTIEQFFIYPNTRVSAKQLCVSPKKADHKEIGGGGKLVGFVRNYAIFACLDCKDYSLSVVDAKKAQGFLGSFRQSVFHANHAAIHNGTLASAAYGQPSFFVKQSAEKLSLRFFKYLEVSCSPMVEGEACWKRIAKENALPNSITSPDCVSVYTKWNKDGAPWKGFVPGIAVLVTVDDLAHPKERIEGEKAYCFVPG